MNNSIGSRAQSEPDTELLRLQGWSIVSTFGRYCTAWQGNSERLFVWQGDHWQPLSGGLTLAG